jgi:DNA repair protein RecN (Recombination protein N)
MLSRLSIRDVVLIDKLDLAFGDGLIVLTGETGAGKSILLDSLGLATGQRAEAGIVRPGAAQATVSAEFELSPAHPARHLAREHDIEIDSALIVRRSVGADGRSRAYVNDQPVSIALLRQLGRLVVETHGQFDNQGLLDPIHHRAALDSFAGSATSLAALETRHAAWKNAIAAEQAARDDAANAVRDEAFLRHALGELDSIAPKPDEEAELTSRRAFLASGEKLASAIRAALAALHDDKGVTAAIAVARRSLERVQAAAPERLAPALAALDRAAAETADALGEIEALADAVDTDPRALERVDERLFVLRSTARKHRVTVDQLPALRENFTARIAALDHSGELLAKLEKQTREERARYLETAAIITAARRAAAVRLDTAMKRELAPLRLDKAVFRTTLEDLPEDSWSAAGRERVVFEVATNPGAPAGPIDRIASGGELARFMLALKAVLVGEQDATTMIFDEVDSGIGGATAAAVGERIAKLAAGRQILVVTHSPQVAARGREHWRVSKRTAQGRALTSVESLDGTERREEIARMLAGASVTDAARAAADELLRGGDKRRRI